MAEISEAPSTDSPHLETIRKTRPGLKRLTLTLSVLFSFISGLPFLLKSIEIYRSPLPFREIDNLSAAIDSNPLLFPCQFQAIFVNFRRGLLTANELSLTIESHMRKLSDIAFPSCGACDLNSSVSVTLDYGSECVHTSNNVHWMCGSLNEHLGKYDDQLLDEDLQVLLDDSSGSNNIGKVYTVVVVRMEESSEARMVVGKYRHAWIAGSVLEEEAGKIVAETFVKVFANGGKEEGSIRAEFMPVGADGRIVLSFNLLNADPSNWIYDWDFRDADVNLLSPLIEAMKPLADVSVESQVLYHTPKSSFSYWDEQLGSYIFNTKNLPFFVNSNEWHLDTSVAAGGLSKILQFVVYVPSASECPLLLQLPNGEVSMTNGFISPMWGSVLVWNPPGCLNDTNIVPHGRYKISPEDLRRIFEVFVGQLRQLFGLKSNGFFGDRSGALQILASERGFTEWELDVLSRQHTCYNLLQCSTTLGSLYRLVQSLPRMIIKDEIGKQVKFSLEAAKLTLSNVSHGAYDASAVSSRQAKSFAEDAFYHPSMMSVSYYSFEHCFAVYSPFFLPVSLHVILAVLREWKRYKQESNRYKAWKATLN